MRAVISLTHVQAILFDLDGTLVETDNRWAKIIADKLQPLRRVLPRLDVEALGREVVMGIEMPANYAISTLEHLGLSRYLQGVADRVRRSKGLATRGDSTAVEGSDELLRALHGRFKMAVVTTRARPEALAFLQKRGWDRFFPVLVTRQDVFRMKPHPEPVRRAAALLGVPVDCCVMIGDTTMDIRAARRAGVFAVGVLSGFGDRRELERAGAQLILERAEQLLAYLP